MSPKVELVIGIASAAMFVGTIAAIPWFVSRLPADYFVKPPPEHTLAKKIARNVLGFALIAAGVAMLVLPGQGILTILIGLSIVDLKAKHSIMRRILRQPSIQNAMQKIRTSAGRPPLIIPTEGPTEGPREGVREESHEA